MSNQLAEALRLMVKAFDHGDVMASEGAAIEAAKQALAAHEAAKPESLGEVVEMDDGCSVVVWRDGTPEPGTKLYAAPVAVASQWEPIETAPKDGSLLLLWDGYDMEPFIGHWHESQARWRASTALYDTDGDACVIDRVYSEGVTHWMPLPPAPKEQA